MVERALQHDANDVILSVRIDGKIQLKNRSQAIQQLHENPSIRVILITIACGACGYVHALEIRQFPKFADTCGSLDLTAASVVHLLEPQWNPSTEDQALARVHRLGQTHPVITIRYVMENSFEEVRAPPQSWLTAWSESYWCLRHSLTRLNSISSRSKIARSCFPPLSCQITLL